MSSDRVEATFNQLRPGSSCAGAMLLRLSDRMSPFVPAEGASRPRAPSYRRTTRVSDKTSSLPPDRHHERNPEPHQLR